MSTNTETLSLFLQSFLGGDLETAQQYLHPDVVADEPPSLPYGGKYHGKKEFIGLMQTIGATVEVDVLEHEMLDAGDKVILRMPWVRFTARENSKSVEMPVCEIYSFTDGLISRVELFYKDTKEFIDTTGLGLART